MSHGLPGAPYSGMSRSSTAIVSGIGCGSAMPLSSALSASMMQAPPDTAATATPRAFGCGALAKNDAGVEQRLDLVDDDHAGALEGRAVRGLRAGHRAGVRHRGLRAALAGAELVHDQRLAGVVAQLGGLQESLRIGHALEQAGHRLARRVGREVGDLVGHVDVATRCRRSACG